MTVIGQTPATVEYTITPDRGNGYGLEVDAPDGHAEIGRGPSVTQLHSAARRHARKHGYREAGLTEAFGRNRQFVFTPRGALNRFKEVSS